MGALPITAPAWNLWGCHGTPQGSVRNSSGDRSGGLAVGQAGEDPLGVPTPEGIGGGCRPGYGSAPRSLPAGRCRRGGEGEAVGNGAAPEDNEDIGRSSGRRGMTLAAPEPGRDVGRTGQG
ncbi:hypothetical protein GCM10010518_01540 [Kitasatospora cinereorecta]